MRFQTMEISNFRGIEHLRLDLDPRCNVLAGENGAGKTAVLDALAIAIGGYFYGFEMLPTPGLSDSDARCISSQLEGIWEMQAQYPVAIACTAQTAETPAAPLTWQRSRKRAGAGVTRGEFSQLSGYGAQLRAAIRKPATAAIALPIVLYFRTDRVAANRSLGKRTGKERALWTRPQGYFQCLDTGGKSSMARVRAWLRRHTYAALQAGTPVPQLKAIEEAVTTCLPELTRFYFHVQMDELCVEFRERGALPFTMLSDGYRSMVQLAAETAWRAVVLNPQLGADAARSTPGVVLIDEVDLSLHPAWQRRVLADLQRAFPLVQFIATTHSPQVLGEVPREQVLLLHGQGAVHPEVARGADTNWILDHVMDKASSENAEARALRAQAEDAMEEGDYSGAESTLEKLEALLEDGQTSTLVRLQSRLASYKALAKGTADDVSGEES